MYCWLILFLEELKVGLQYTQAIMTWEGFLDPANGTVAVKRDAWV